MSFAGLNDRVVIVTGAAQGIGREYARRLVDEGCRVVVADFNADKGEAVAAELGDRAVFAHADVADEAACDAMARTALDSFGRIDGLVNNAAIFSTIKMKPFWEITVDEWDSLMAVNLRGVWLASKAVLPAMRQQGSGSIVNISSAVVWIGRERYAHYVASKGGVFAMTRAMAKEAGELGVRINTVTPGATYTEVPRETVTEAQTEAMLRVQCVKRPGTPQDVVGAVAFLLSDDASFISGQALNVDGGLALH